MATNDTQAAKTDEKPVAESTGLTTKGTRTVPKTGYQYQYVSTRDENGKLATNRIVTKTGGK